MAGYGYGNVTDRGLASFMRELSLGRWAEVSIEELDDPGTTPVAKASLLEAPAPVQWKLRITWALRSLARALGSATADELSMLDDEWDSAQRALHLHLSAEAEHQDPARREGAQRLRTSLLMGGGTGQTRLSYDREVDFGHTQLQLAAGAPLSHDAERADLSPFLQRIHDATSALASALGRAPDQPRTHSRSRRIRDALSECRTALNAAHEQLDWLLEHTTATRARTRLEGLRAPLLELLQRYPSRAEQGGNEDEEGERNGVGEAEDVGSTGADSRVASG